eukprot:m.83526 g.83526  ORF g.83526 m.83526 type:complete len:65 (+) comp12925_c0_seq2:804-998(+)
MRSHGGITIAYSEGISALQEIVGGMVVDVSVIETNVVVDDNVKDDCVSVMVVVNGDVSKHVNVE